MEPLHSRPTLDVALSLGMAWVPAKAWRVTPQIAATQTRSKVAINEFDTQTISVTVRREF